MTTIEALRHLITSLAHYGSDGEGYEASQEGHAQGVFDHIHGLVRICSWPLLDCLIDSVWLMFCWFGSWWVPGASGRPREVAETPSDGLGVPSGVPRSPRGLAQKYKNIYLLWSPCKRLSLGAGFVFGPLVWMKTYHCPSLHGGRPLSAELVDLATIACR